MTFTQTTRVLCFGREARTGSGAPEHSGKRGQPLRLLYVSHKSKKSWWEQDLRCFFFCDRLCSAILTYRSLVWSLFTPRSVSWTEAAEAQTLKNYETVSKGPQATIDRKTWLTLTRSSNSFRSSCSWRSASAKASS